MSNMTSTGGIKQSSIAMVVIGADGKPKANLGVVSYYHKNPFIRFFKGRWISFFANRRIKAYNESKE